MALKFSSISGGSSSGIQSGSTANRPASPSTGDQFYNGTLGRLEIYTGTQWMAVGGQTRTPSISGATDVGTSRAFNNAAAQVTVVPNTEGGLPTSYTVTSSPGSLSATGASPVTVTGLNSNTAYTFTATASNDYGSASSASVASSSVTVTSVPQAPTVSTPTIVAGTNFGSTTSLDVPFTAGATGGKTVTSYTVTSSPGGFTASGSASPLRVSGLTGGTSYTFTATATNANGTSLASSASPAQNAVTKPDAPVLGTPTATNATTVSLPFTINNGGQTPTSFTVTSSPSISLTTTGTTSPLTVTGSFAGGTSYTFTATATNGAGTSNASSASTSVIPNPTYSLQTTYNNSGTFTMPAGKTKVAVYAFSGANNGASGSAGNSGGSGGVGGQGSRGAAFTDYTASPGTNFTVTIGASGGGTTSFGNLLAVSPNATNTANVAGTVSAAGGNGGSGGAASQGAGSSGNAGGALTLNSAGVTNYNAGGGGGGGGGGAIYTTMPAGKAAINGAGIGGGPGGAQYTQGGSGGGGQWDGYYNGTGWSAGNGGSGSSGTLGNGGGGGGGGGRTNEQSGQGGAGGPLSPTCKRLSSSCRTKVASRKS